MHVCSGFIYFFFLFFYKAIPPLRQERLNEKKALSKAKEAKALNASETCFSTLTQDMHLHT